MAIICPTVLAEDLHSYRNQLERIESFAKRIQFDFMDGLFTSTKSVDLNQVWMPENAQADLHLMYMRPDLYIDDILRLQPSLVIVHAEAQGNYQELSKKLRSHNIKVGVCLLQETEVSVIQDSLEHIDHVLVFSGDLGHFGGTVNLDMLHKATQLKKLRPNLEIGWDGGVNDKNIKQLADGGIDVLNVGGFIQKAENPKAQFDQLVDLLQ